MKLYLTRTDLIANIRDRIAGLRPADKGQVRLSKRYCEAVVKMLKNPELDEVIVVSYERRTRSKE